MMLSRSSCFMKDVEATLSSEINSLSKELRTLSLDIHHHPKLAWKEHHAHDALVNFMRDQPGFSVTPHAYGVDTTWEAVYENKQGGRTVGFNSEYDALPRIGHACGHNLIAIGGVAAAIAFAHVLEKYDIPGKVVLLGTPAEEVIGGKLKLIAAGAYKQMDLCLMIHPAPLDHISSTHSLIQVECKYTGHAAHASVAPAEGINALDAAVTAYNAISVLRQELLPNDSVQAVIYLSEDSAVNVIPDACTIKSIVRSLEYERLLELQSRVENCLQSGAMASGCQASITWTSAVKNLRINDVLARTYTNYMKSHGHPVFVAVGDYARTDLIGLTDFGNVSHEVPALHPMFEIPTHGLDGGNHTAAFADSAATQEAHDNTLRAATAVALAGIKAVIEESYYAEIRVAFEKDNAVLLEQACL